MYLYAFNIDLCISSYHIRVIDIRFYNKDSYRITSHSQVSLLVGVHPVHPTTHQTPYLTPAYDKNMWGFQFGLISRLTTK